MAHIRRLAGSEITSTNKFNDPWVVVFGNSKYRKLMKGFVREVTKQQRRLAGKHK